MRSLHAFQPMIPPSSSTIRQYPVILQVVPVLYYASQHARTPTQDGRTPLYNASYYGHDSVVDRLISARASINMANQVDPHHATASIGDLRHRSSSPPSPPPLPSFGTLLWRFL